MAYTVAMGTDGVIRVRRSPIATLASYRRCENRMMAGWSGFQARREERLAQQERFGEAAEKIAADILEDLFTSVLDWRLSEVSNQVTRADMVLTRLGIKQLIVAVKRPGSLAWDQHSVDVALAQVRRYADEQRVRSIAVSDGIVLYARDIVSGGYRDRILARLDEPRAPGGLWWLSADGIYRPRLDAGYTS